jgi:hypothetical protein
MGRNTNQINSNTQIIFTLKGFITTIGFIIGIFYGFYQLVVIPKIEKTDEHYEKMFDNQREQNRIFYEKLNDINSSIGSFNASINALNEQNRGFKPKYGGGSFGEK